MIGSGNSINTASSASERGQEVQAESVDKVVTLDDRFAQIATEVPGFGGMFFDENGTPTVYMLDDRAVDHRLVTKIEQALGQTVLGGEQLPKTGLQVLQGQYSFLQLKRWYDQMWVPVLEIPEVVMTDIDEAKNRLRIGVENLGMEPVVEEYLAQLGIPREAVVIEQTDPIVMLTSLRDRHRPLVGGLQINFSGFLCTIGFNAVRQGVNGFVTCSHCTDIQGGVEGTVYHQHLASGTTNRVGLEIADPTYFTGSPCPSGRRCRRSDSAFVQVPHPSGPSVTQSLGFVARPNSGSFAWNGTNTFRITAEADPLVGQTIIKVGRTTGRSSGPVTSTCVNVGVSGTNITQLCQSFATTTVAGGDSGSPVIRITSGTDVQLKGILWGGGGASIVFSPISGVQLSSELGTLTTCATGGC
jgi:hypothetical protein